MAKWKLEPGHSAVQFRVKHMMVVWIRGSFKNIQGKLTWDEKNPSKTSVQIEIDTKGIWSGEKVRDKHLKGEGFLEVRKYPKIKFVSKKVTDLRKNKFKITGDLTIRGITKKVTLDTEYLGQWKTPFWEDGVDKGPKNRAGFLATTKINRHDFGVSWQSKMDKGGVVVGDDVFITIDIEAIKE